jgi:peroxiredoxin
MSTKGIDRADLVDQLNTYLKQGEFEKALAGLEELLEVDGETVNILDAKSELLIKTGRYQDAILTTLKLDEIAIRKSPWYLLRIAEACIALGELDEAFGWIGKAISERGFRRVRAFENEIYHPITGDERFPALIEKARENIGLGKPFHDFSVVLLDGKTLSLSSQKGRVVLVDFWSTTCSPCVRELPYVKILYNGLKDQGFAIIGISLDEDRGKLLSFVGENDLSWPVSCSGMGWLDDTVARFKINALPSIWLIDRQGVLRYFDVRGDELGNAVKSLLSEYGDDAICIGDTCTVLR